LDLVVTVKNFSEKNVAYTAQFTDSKGLLEVQERVINPVPVGSNGTQMKVKFTTFQISSALDVRTLDKAAISKISAQKPYREDYATIENWTANLNIDLPAGRFIVLAECSELTANYGLELFNVSQIVVATPTPGITIAPVTKIPVTLAPVTKIPVTPLPHVTIRPLPVN